MAKRFLTPINLPSRSSDPATASDGDLYFNTSLDIIKVYYNSAWNPISGETIFVSDTPPVSPTEGQLWYESDSGDLFIRYDNTWVQTGGGGGGGGGNEVFYQDDIPTSALKGDIWVDSNQTVISVNANDFVPKSGGTFTGIINAPTASAGTNNNQVATTEFVISALSGVSGGAEISDSAPSSPEVGSIWYNSLNGRTYLYYEDESSSQWVEIGTASLNPVANYDGGSPSSVFGGVSSLDGGGVT